MEFALYLATGLLYVAAVPWLLSIGRDIWASRVNNVEHS